MPGSSLWLLPPANSPLDAILSAQIDTVSKHFHSEHRFLPHVTLTSGISESTYTPDPQAWLNNLSLPSDVRVKFEKVASEDAFVKKLYINVVKDDSVRELGEAARRTVEDGERAKAWAKDEYLPHLSLM
jgi:2',3'-cyclic-nucleotide 3'-phosphodiesterase